MRALVALLLVVVIGLLLVVGAVATRWLARHIRDMRELSRYRRLVHDLAQAADLHSALDDPFAVIVADEIRKSNINPPKGLR